MIHACPSMAIYLYLELSIFRDVPDPVFYRIQPDIKFHWIPDNTRYRFAPDTGYLVVLDTQILVDIRFNRISGTSILFLCFLLFVRVCETFNKVFSYLLTTLKHISHIYLQRRVSIYCEYQNRSAQSRARLP